VSSSSDCPLNLTLTPRIETSRDVPGLSNRVDWTLGVSTVPNNRRITAKDNVFPLSQAKNQVPLH